MSAGLASESAALTSADADAHFQQLHNGDGDGDGDGTGLISGNVGAGSGEIAQNTDADKQPFSLKACTQWVVALLRKQLFVVCIALSIGLAAVAPFGRNGGPLRPEWSVSYGLIPIIFLLSGLSLKWTDLLYAARVLRLNALVQCYNLGFIPAVMYGVSQLLRHTTSIDSTLLDGIVVCACVPTTLSTCNILTRTAGATQSIALFNSAFGNLFGLVYTPGMLLWLLKSQSSVGLMSVLQQLLLVLLLPLVVGQMIQCVFKERLAPLYPYVNPIIQAILVVIVFCAFCDTFDPAEANAPHASAASIAPVMVITSCLYILFLTLARALFSAECLAFRRADQVAAWFCATQKTVAMGLPLLKIIYKGNPNLGLICVPLLTYHPTQLLVGSMLIPRIKGWMAADPRAEPVPDGTAAAKGDVSEASVSRAAPRGDVDGLDDTNTGGVAGGPEVAVSIYANRASGAGVLHDGYSAVNGAL